MNHGMAKRLDQEIREAAPGTMIRVWTRGGHNWLIRLRDCSAEVTDDFQTLSASFRAGHTLDGRLLRSLVSLDEVEAFQVEADGP